MLNSVVAVLAGYIVLAVIVMLGTALAVRAILRQLPSALRAPAPGYLTTAYLAANLAASALAAVAAGFVTAAIAGHARLSHGLALAGVMVVLSLLSMQQAGASEPRWYQLVLATVMPAIAVGGAFLCGALARVA